MWNHDIRTLYEDHISDLQWMNFTLLKNSCTVLQQDLRKRNIHTTLILLHTRVTEQMYFNTTLKKGTKHTMHTKIFMLASEISFGEVLDQ